MTNKNEPPPKNANLPYTINILLLNIYLGYQYLSLLISINIFKISNKLFR